MVGDIIPVAISDRETLQAQTLQQMQGYFVTGLSCLQENITVLGFEPTALFGVGGVMMPVSLAWVIIGIGTYPPWSAKNSPGPCFYRQWSGITHNIRMTTDRRFDG